MKVQFGILSVLFGVLHMSVYAQEPVNYKPQIFGAVKAKLEINTNSGEYRFNVRNSRFGVKGLITPNTNYRIQVDFNNEGKISILDSYLQYTYKGFGISLGQQQYKFSTDLDRGASGNLFANRSFIAKYLTGYWGEENISGKAIPFVKSIGSRDLGVLTIYTFKTRMPLKLILGIFNGTGANNPEWTKKVNITSKIELGGDTGLRLAAAYYTGSVPSYDKPEQDPNDPSQLNSVKTRHPIRMIGGEIRYASDRYVIEGEVAARKLLGEFSGTMTAAHIQGYYKFPLPKNTFADYIAPIFRWDIGDNVDYLNTLSNKRATFTANRLTFGTNFGLGEFLARWEIRLNYEIYMLKARPSDFQNNHLLNDKFTLEVLAVF